MEDIKNEESFEELLNKSSITIKRFEPGESLTTEIVAISDDFIFLNLDGKREGVMDASELKDAEGEITVKVGDSIDVYFLEGKNQEMIFTTKVKGEKVGSAILENAHKAGIPVEGKVEAEIKGGFSVILGDTKAFCPFSQMGMSRVENAADYVGKTFTFKVIEYKEGGRNILVSNRAILEEEKQKKLEELKSVIIVGEKLKAKVVSLQDFGAFVDLGGIQALLPISEISRTRIEKVSDHLAIDQEIVVEVLSADWKLERFSVSMKALTPDPWDEIAKKYAEGTKHDGEIVRTATFGVFVNLEPGIDGLVHISELGSGSRDNNPRAMYKSGEKMSVVVKSIDIKNRRISLSPMKKVMDDKIIEKYSGSSDDAETYNPFADLLKK